MTIFRAMMHFFSSMIDSYSNKYLVLLVLARYEKIMKAVVSGSRQHNHSQHTHTHYKMVVLCTNNSSPSSSEGGVGFKPLRGVLASYKFE